jgi:putative transposase
MKVAGSEERSLGTLCGLLGVTRQAYYQQKRRIERDAMQKYLLLEEVVKIREGQRNIGVRKLYFMTTEKRHEHGITMGRDAFFSMMREEGMLVRKRRSRKPRTTFSAWWMKRYPNLVKEFCPSAPNQLWVSDITYIRVRFGFAYLSLVTDAYSRKIVGYHLCRDLSAKGCVKALQMALANNPDRAGLIHHSDRGLQYYSTAYMKLLGEHIRISMTEKGDPLENAIAERVNGILKGELLERRFERLAEAPIEVARAVSTYNHLRPHLSIDMLTPAVAHEQRGPLKRHWKNYYTSIKKGGRSSVGPGQRLSQTKSVNTFQD